MSDIAAYLLSVMSAAIICALLNDLFQKKDGVSGVIRMITGVFLSITLLQPILNFSLSDALWWVEDYSIEASGIVAEGEQMANTAMKECIKEQTEAYILNKAKQMQVSIVVEVELNDDDPPIPVAVAITGKLTPYAKSSLKQFLVSEIGIAKENLLWIG